MKALKVPNIKKQHYLPLEGVVCNRKSVKKLLLAIGFHHSWGYYVRNTNKHHKILVGKDHIELTKHSNVFNDSMIFRNKTNEEIQTKILRYFYSVETLQ